MWSNFLSINIWEDRKENVIRALFLTVHFLWLKCFSGCMSSGIPK